MKYTSSNRVKLDDMYLHYLVYGSGKEVIVCFHGHGKSAEDFSFLASEKRKVISISLFLHGNSTFSNDRIDRRLITSNDVEKLLEKIFTEEKVRNFHLVAYSQGGRFALTIIPSFSNRIKTINLLAVDGLNDNNFYSWSQRRWWARKLFKRWVHRPKELVYIARILAKLKLIHQKLVDFINFYAIDKEKIKLAYQTWSAFRALRPNEKELTKALNQNTIPFQLIIGKYDKIITKDSAEKFLTRIDQSAALTIVPIGHDFFHPEAIKLIKPKLNEGIKG